MPTHKVQHLLAHPCSRNFC